MNILSNYVLKCKILFYLEIHFVSVCVNKLYLYNGVTMTTLLRNVSINTSVIEYQISYMETKASVNEKLLA